MTDDLLRELGKQLPYDRPDTARRDALRSSLLVAAAEGEQRTGPRKRWLVVGAAFASGALAAAAVAVLLARDPRGDVDLPNPAQITASSEARLDHQVVATETGVDEIVRVHAGTVRIAAPAPRRGDRVRLRTRDAEVATTAASEYEVVVVAESLDAVTVRSGTAEIRVTGQKTVLLSAGQTWRASIITTDLSPGRPADKLPSSATPGTSDRPDTVAAVPDGSPDNPDTSVRRSDTTGARANADTTVRPAAPDAPVRRTDTTVRAPNTPGRADTTVARAPADTTARAPDTTTVARDTTVRRPNTPPTTVPDVRQPKTVRTTDTPDTTARTPDATVDDSRTLADGMAGVRDADKATGTPRTARPIEQRFQAGWAMLKAGKAREAAAELGAAADAAPDDPLAADARYFQAVALVRAGDRGQAERVLIRFLDNAPKSLRRGRAAVLLGRLIADRGDLASARAWLESAVADPDPAIAAAAKAGLQSLDRRR